MKIKMKIKKTQKAQMPAFAWIFSILIGALILFFAFYFVTQFGKQVAKPEQQITLASGLALLLEPFTVIGSIAEAQSDLIELPKGIEIEFDCNRIKDYSEIKAKLLEHKTYDLTEKVYDKYIYSHPIKIKEKTKQTKFWVASLPLKKPFFIATPIFIATKSLCWVNLPSTYKESIEPILSNLNQTQIRFSFTNSPANCEQSLIICINRKDCDLNIECFDSTCSYGVVSGKYWFDELIFPALFATKSLYDCNLDRILIRLQRIAEILKEKVKFVSSKGCDTKNLLNLLETLKTKAENFRKNKNKENLEKLYETLIEIEVINSQIDLDCRI